MRVQIEQQNTLRWSLPRSHILGLLSLGMLEDLEKRQLVTTFDDQETELLTNYVSHTVGQEYEGRACTTFRVSTHIRSRHL